MQLAEFPQLYLHIEPCLALDLLALQLMSKLGLDPSASSGFGTAWAGLWWSVGVLVGFWCWLWSSLASLLSVAAPVSLSYSHSQRRERVSPSIAIAVFFNVNHLSNSYNLSRCSLCRKACHEAGQVLCVPSFDNQSLIVCHSRLVPPIGKFMVIKQMSNGAAVCMPRCGASCLNVIC